jgi:hypothetical protein
MNGFFTPQLLNGARLVVLRGGQVANPPFYPMLVGMGFSKLPDLSSKRSAVTFFDVVVSHVPLADQLLFHELVHVEQYLQFGIPRFSQLYVRGFFSGGGDDSIPLELTPPPGSRLGLKQTHNSGSLLPRRWRLRDVGLQSAQKQPRPSADINMKKPN